MIFKNSVLRVFSKKTLKRFIVSRGAERLTSDSVKSSPFRTSKSKRIAGFRRGMIKTKFHFRQPMHMYVIPLGRIC